METNNSYHFEFRWRFIVYNIILLFSFGYFYVMCPPLMGDVIIASVRLWATSFPCALKGRLFEEEHLISNGFKWVSIIITIVHSYGSHLNKPLKLIYFVFILIGLFEERWEVIREDRVEWDWEKTISQFVDYYYFFLQETVSNHSDHPSNRIATWKYHSESSYLTCFKMKMKAVFYWITTFVFWWWDDRAGQCLSDSCWD